jgi:ABC-type lipoprotein release transport system permease subunit
MKISDLLKMGLKSLFRRKTRTILTTLGVVIGSLCIIITISIGNGVNDNFKQLVMTQGGLTTINVNSYADVFDEDGNWVNSKEQTLDDNLVDQIDTIKHVRAVSPVIQTSGMLYSGKYMTWINICAMKSDTFDDFDFPALQYGAFPTEEDNTPIVFGAQSIYQFYDSSYRKQVTIDIQKQRVELKFQQYMPSPDKKKKEFSLPLKNIAMMEQSNTEYDGSAYVDMDYFKKIYEKYCNTLSLQDRKQAIKVLQNYSTIKLNVDNINNVEEVQNKIEDMGFQSYSMIQYLLPLKKASENIQLILLVMGIIVMFASAISIANTMVMSIYERTKEIGVMKVLGCTISDIRKLFLFEAAIIGLLGGVIGIIFGYVASFLINRYGAPIFSTLMSGNFTGDMTSTKFSIIPYYLPLMSLGISICVGLVSGYFPARRATKIKAIEAMKTEG